AAAAAPAPPLAPEGLGLVGEGTHHEERRHGGDGPAVVAHSAPPWLRGRRCPPTTASASDSRLSQPSKGRAEPGEPGRMGNQGNLVGAGSVLRRAEEARFLMARIACSTRVPHANASS